VVKSISRHHASHINTGGNRRPGRTSRSHCRSAQLAVNQNPISGEVDEICRDDRKQHGAWPVGRLQIPSESEVDKQRWHAPDQRWNETGDLTLERLLIPERL